VREGDENESKERKEKNHKGDFS